MDQAGLVSGAQGQRRLREQTEPNARRRRQRRPIGAGHSRQPFLQHGRPAGQLDDLIRRGNMRVPHGRRRGKALTEFVRMNGVLHLPFRQPSQQRLAVAARIENPKDGLARPRLEAVDNAHRPEDQAVKVAGLDQRHLIKR